MGNKFIAVLTLMLITTATIAAEHTVEMKNMIGSTFMVFEPGVLKVAVGDTVHFIPSDVGHNSQSVEGLTPEGAKAWKGDINQKISVTVDKEGVYVYQCFPHSMMAMVGVIVAGEPTNLETIKANIDELKSNFVVANDRLDNYLAQVK